MATKKNTPQQQQDAPANYSTLAGHIAAILAHPDTPVSIYNALGDAVHSLDAPPRYFDSEEYVALCLRVHLKGEGSSPNN
jgi:hypothetical protein